MTLEVITPTLGKSKKNVKDLVISALMYNYPLTLIKLTNTIKKKFSAKVTFQGVRRAVNSLVDEEIILKINREYKLNQEWILKMKDFFDKLNDSYSNPDGEILNIEELGEDVKIYTMKNLIEADKLWNKTIKKWFERDKNKKSEIYAQFAGHTWYVFGQMGEETEIVDLSKKYKIKPFILSNSDTFLDRWCKKYYENLGAKYTTNKEKSKGDNSKYFGVYKDRIIQIETPREITKKMDEIYSKTKNFSTFNSPELTKELLKTRNIKVIIMRNNLLAEQLRKNVLNHFR
jgi:adenylate kinase family enzyme